MPLASGPMATIDIANLDLTPYQTTPLLSAEATLTLSLDLHTNKPANGPPHVEKAAKRMLETASEIKQVLITRLELAGINLRAEMSFDNACDRFWVSVRHRFLYWMNYDHEGLDLLNEDEQGKIELDDKLEKAELARELDKHLFGIDGLKFLGKPFNQQVALMASRLSFVAANDKFSDYEEVIGPDLLNTLNVLQGRYERMVHDRSSRDDDGAGLRELRHTLQRRIALYTNAMLTMIDEEDPDSVELVLAALRPMINARVRKGGSDDETQDSSEPEGEGLPLPADMLEGDPAPAQENADSK
jgi:hypothetical protein